MEALTKPAYLLEHDWELDPQLLQSHRRAARSVQMGQAGGCLQLTPL